MSNPKHLLTTSVVLFLCTASAKATGIFLYNADCSLKYMNQSDAMVACPAGTHLPTIRELALEGQAQGAKGILELSQVNPGSISSGFYKISAIGPNGQKDEFYFNEEGYKYGPGEGAWYWSSSIPSSAADVLVGYVHAGIPYGPTGTAFRNDDKEIAVRCFPGH